MRSRSRRPVVPSTPFASLVLYVALAGALGACGVGTASDAPGSSAEVGATGLQLREVTTTATTAGASAPTVEQQTDLDTFDCDDEHPTAPAEEPMIACDEAAQTYLLEPAGVDGGVEAAEANVIGEGARYAVQITFGPDSSQRLADLTGALVGTSGLLAVVFEGQVLAAPAVGDRIVAGVIQIGGDYTEAEATDLAETIQAGA